MRTTSGTDEVESKLKAGLDFLVTETIFQFFIEHQFQFWIRTQQDIEFSKSLLSFKQEHRRSLSRTLILDDDVHFLFKRHNSWQSRDKSSSMSLSSSSVVSCLSSPKAFASSNRRLIEGHPPFYRHMSWIKAIYSCPLFDYPLTDKSILLHDLFSKPWPKNPWWFCFVLLFCFKD